MRRKIDPLMTNTFVYRMLVVVIKREMTEVLGDLKKKSTDDLSIFYHQPSPPPPLLEEYYKLAQHQHHEDLINIRPSGWEMEHIHITTQTSERQKSLLKAIFFFFLIKGAEEKEEI